MPDDRSFVPSTRKSRPAQADTPQQSARGSFLLSRWRGEAPLRTVFWRDMIVVGTVLNAVAALIAFALVALEAPTAIAVIVFFAPVPWNLFLFFSVWRGATRSDAPDAMFLKAGALIWLVLVTAV